MADESQGIRIPGLDPTPPGVKPGPAWMFPVYNPDTDTTYRVSLEDIDTAESAASPNFPSKANDFQQGQPAFATMEEGVVWMLRNWLTSTGNVDLGEAPSVALRANPEAARAGDSIELTVLAVVNASTSVKKVEIKNGETLLYTFPANATSYKWNWANVGKGEYAVYAVVTDQNNAVGKSRPIPLLVTEAGGSTTPIIQVPTLTTAQPASANIGAQVVLGGTNLTGAIVAFNGVAAAPISITATQIVVNVPNGATTGNITASTQGGTATLYFTVTAPVVYTSANQSYTTTAADYKAKCGSDYVGNYVGVTRANSTSKSSESQAKANELGLAAAKSDAINAIVCVVADPVYNTTLEKSNPVADGFSFVPTGNEKMKFDLIVSTSGPILSLVINTANGPCYLDYCSEYGGKPYNFIDNNGTAHYGTLPSSDATISY